MTSVDPVLIVGSMAFDDLELPTGKARDVVGGAATYAALASSLFTQARIVAVVGEDFPPAFMADLERRQVNTAGIARVPGLTFRWSGRYSQHLDYRTTLDTQLNVFRDFRPVLPEYYRDARVVLLANIHPLLQLEVLDQLRQPPRLAVADTMNYWIENERKALDAVLGRVDTLVINDEELRLLAGEHSIRQAAQAVLALGPKRLICKRGEHGALLFDARGVFSAPCYPLVRTIDPTGAGDTFAGALVGYLAHASSLDDVTLRRALLVASSVASFAVEAVGTERLGTVTREEVWQRLGELERMIAYSPSPRVW